MRYSAVLGLSALAAAAPLEVRQSGPTDAQILNYALTLEYLESTFYNQTLAKFSKKDFDAAGLPDYFYNDLKEVASDEATHVSFLSGALTNAGATPVQACSYNFGLDSVNTFLQVANILEGVGVSAYLGAAASIANKAYLTYAGSILTVEARHSAFIRKNQKPRAQTPFPSPFDIPLDFDEVYSLATLFITSCPSSNPALPFKAFPALSSLSYSPNWAGQMIAVKPAQTVSAAAAWFITTTGPVQAQIKQEGTQYDVLIPSGVQAGQEYLVLTSDTNKPTDDNIVAGPAVIAIVDSDTMHS